MSENQNGNLSAFSSSFTDGLTKREYFAGQAMQGLMVSCWELSDMEIAKMSVDMADALLEALDE